MGIRQKSLMYGLDWRISKALIKSGYPLSQTPTTILEGLTQTQKGKTYSPRSPLSLETSPKGTFKAHRHMLPLEVEGEEEGEVEVLVITKILTEPRHTRNGTSNSQEAPISQKKRLDRTIIQ